MAVMAIFSPTRALVRVDLPVFGRPTKLTKPERKPSGVSVNELMGTPWCAGRVCHRIARLAGKTGLW